MRGNRDHEKAVLSISLLTGLFLLFLSSSAFAEKTESTASRHAFQIGLVAAYFEYDEDSVNVEMDGPMYGISGSYTYHNKTMIHVGLEYSRGDLNYDGAYVDYRDFSESVTPDRTDAVDWKVECRWLIGYDCLIRSKHVVTPFLGIGYRYLNDHLEGSVYDELVIESSKREISYWYSPIGFMTHSPLSDNWTWGLTLEYDLFWDGKVEGRYAFSIPELDQDSGFGLRFSLRFNRRLADHYAFSIEPFIRYWDIDQSETEFFVLPKSYGDPSPVFGYFEPENDTTSYGLQISLVF
ncbi:MAG: autotransporter outer membrane beta-barrel domain-containing protein [Thermodesulfobacteriota bacterium]|nr:autotransporter outer membrane beta-barrel domain-containing protein [Thermodesulfobacteriota bacterium]